MMRTLKLFFCLFLAISFNSNAQETDFTSEVATYLESNGTLNQYEFAYDELLKMLGKQYPKSESTANGWEFLESNKEKAVAEIKKELVPIYQQNFERSEIKEMTTFYRSPTGKQLTIDRSKMSAIQKEELNAFYNSDLGKKILAKQPILAKEVSAASESWSRDLYETALSLLKE
ncbi:DUF2059 domain-containing protein [Maribacter algarum]|uniref:DUF2059 domain-containing protein n=1 Tax=Maribacter algarum (ex Zhang et al. 2020) TaxID=2578118 RepID=A0A5S3PXQ6_9FLAO|nr:DUF2059 domain-containing protein [Maribacter algarum]TMM58057.1 DUF2059 domain-containing protein [Maribacter algarum]